VSECKNHAEVCWKSQTQEDDESFRDNRQAEERGWAIPAAGLGTRLLSVTKEQPKEMLPVFAKAKNGHP
jgi:hypothetical protein